MPDVELISTEDFASDYLIGREVMNPEDTIIEMDEDSFYYALGNGDLKYDDLMDII